jgi:DNA-binding winged helix-turn-helix (wHTH) protein
MSQVKTSTSCYRFDDFFLDARNRRLLRNGEPVPLNSKYLDALLLLVSRNGQLVEKQRIFEEVWDGVFVTDAALTQCIKDIRRQLGDDASNPRYIKTVPKHGYIFIGDVVDADDDAIESFRATVNAEGHSEMAAAVQVARPYKFLDYYTEQDARLFFGREQEVDAICSQIVAHRTFILHGRSGVGKSSILRAGLMPRLKAEGHLVFVIRSFTDPVHQMRESVSEAFNAEQHGDTRSSLSDLIARAGDGRCVIFFLDQFEEFFSLLSEDARRNFLSVARDLASGTLPVRLVFALREDLLAEMSQLKSAIPEVFYHEYRLKRLNREQAQIAITGPARAVGCSYEPELVTRLLVDIADPGGIDPPQLQIVCDNLYDSRDARCAIGLEAYERLGGARQILAGYLERVLRRFNASDLRKTKEILTALISEEGERLVLKAAELEARVGRPFDDDLSTSLLIEELVAARVLRRRRQDGASWIELAHDFLTPEIMRWLSADALALKRARGVIERAMENYLTHGLLIDAEAVDLVLPFGEQLGLTGDEADLLLTSALSRARSVPEWLVKSSPRAESLIVDASENNDSEIRLSATAAAGLLRIDAMRRLLRKLGLWDRDLMVRKNASIALATWIGTAVEQTLSDGHNGANAGPIRQAISLAMVRDHNRKLVRLSHLSIPVSLLVVAGLMWVRLRRDGAEIVRNGIGGMLGGAASGIVGGIILGSGLGIAREATPLEGAELVLVLVTLGFFIGAVGGFGVSLGMIALVHVAYRHSKWWSVVGGAAGGAVVGGSTKLLGVDTIRALFGQSPTGITGAFEGAVIGAGLSLGIVIATILIRHSRSWERVLAAALGAMCAGVLLTVIGGNLFSASLEIVARMFANSQIRMDPLAPLFGEVHFGQTTQIVMGALEGLLFGAGVASGIEASGRAEKADVRVATR